MKNHVLCRYLTLMVKYVKKNCREKATKKSILVAAFLWVKKLPKYSVQ